MTQTSCGVVQQSQRNFFCRPTNQKRLKAQEFGVETFSGPRDELVMYMAPVLPIAPNWQRISDRSPF
jgi:hypothetical protein